MQVDQLTQQCGIGLRPSILLIGGGGHCCSVIDVLEQEGKFEIAGIIEHEDALESSLLNYPVLGTDEDLPQLREQYEYGLVTVGQIKSSALRVKLYDHLKELNFILPVIISSRAYVSPHARLGSGTIVMHDALVNAGAKVGINCILNSKTLIEHDVNIGDHCHVSTGSLVNGGTQVGQGTFIGSGTVLRESIQVGQGTFIAAGTKVMKDLPPNSNYRNRL